MKPVDSVRPLIIVQTDHTPRSTLGLKGKFQVSEKNPRKPVAAGRWLSKDDRRSIVDLMLLHERYIGAVAREFGISQRDVIVVLNEYHEEQFKRGWRDGYRAGASGGAPIPPTPGVIRRRAA